MAFECMVKCTSWGYRQSKFKFFVQSIHRFKTIISGQMQFIAPSRTAYFKKEDDEYFSLSVLVEHEPLQLTKNFTFSRQLDSPIQDLLQRVDIKLSEKLEKKLKKNPIDYKLPDVLSSIHRSGKQVAPDSPCRELFDVKGDYVMKILGDSYVVLWNVPWVNLITLPKVILTNSVVYPLKFRPVFCDKETISFKWYRSQLMAAYINTNPCHLTDWVEVGNKYGYKVTDEDIGYYLKFSCVPRNETQTGPEFFEVATVPVIPSRDDYNFIKTHLLTKEKVDDSKIRIVTYNLLADTYTTTKEAKKIFDYCSPQVLNKNSRYHILAWEVDGYNADLLCLQEVDNSLHNCYISPRFEEEGYGSIVCKKANEREGTVCYYNKAKLKLISSEQFTYGQEIMVNRFLKDIHVYLQQNKEFFMKFSELPHSLLLLVLEPLSRQDQLLVVGNVHLTSHPDGDLSRLLQAMCSFSLYESVVEKIREKRPNDKISFILCGDFNSTPECSINELVTNGSISVDHPIWSSEEMKGTKGMSYKLPVNMASAFNNVEFTNYTRSFKGCLDYIYYQSDTFEVSKTFPLPDEDVLSAEVGLPNTHFPSDHVPLIAELQWKT